MAEHPAKRVLRALLPPILPKLYRMLRGTDSPALPQPRPQPVPQLSAAATPAAPAKPAPKPKAKEKPAADPDLLFDGSGDRFKELMKEVEVYAEYGVGKSSSWVLRKTQAKVLAVDTDSDWIEKVRAEVDAGDRFDAQHVDLGPMKGWGWPLDYRHRARFQDYTDSVWGRGQVPQLVLVDGRFRVCCFLTSLQRAEPGTILIFDDYTNRPHYHVVEEFIHPRETHGRQAIFEVPDKAELDMTGLSECIAHFRYVME